MRIPKIPNPTDQVKVILTDPLAGKYDIGHILSSLKIHFGAFNITMMEVKYQGYFARKMKAACAMKTYEDAKEALAKLVAELDRINESAANSLREGLEETLTVHRFELPDDLRKSFSSTNNIESSFSVGRDMMHNVKRWSTNDQIHRYLATVLLEAEAQFRKIRGHRSMSVLIAALDQEMMKKKFAFHIKVA